MGAFSSVPELIGTNQHKLQALNPVMPGVTPNVTLDFTTNAIFLCTAAKTPKLRMNGNRTTYRYRYNGNFSNISPAESPVRTMVLSFRCYSEPLENTMELPRR
jgi:hypothetical protein